jgi:hypothetical protein
MANAAKQTKPLILSVAIRIASSIFLEFEISTSIKVDLSRRLIPRLYSV